MSDRPPLNYAKTTAFLKALSPEDREQADKFLDRWHAAELDESAGELNKEDRHVALVAIFKGKYSE